MKNKNFSYSINSLNKNALFLAIYIGFFLNYSVYLQRNNSVIMFVLESLTVVLITFWLLKILSLFGLLIYKTFASFFVLCSVAASFYMIFFNVVIGFGAVAAIFTNDFDLYLEVVGLKFLVWCFFVSVIPLFFIWKLKTTKKNQKNKSTMMSLVNNYILPLSFPIIITYCFLTYFGWRYEENAKSLNIDIPSFGGVFAHSYLPINWISALGIFGFTQFEEYRNNKNLFNPALNFEYEAPEEQLKDLYVVFVIGESARYDHFSLFGYHRETTPYLQQENEDTKTNLIFMKGKSCDTSTRLSLRCMFVREGGTENGAGRKLKENNVFAVLKTLGWTSELFSMQSEVSFYKYVFSNNYLIRENIAAEYPNQKVDDVFLIDKLQQSLDKYSEGKHLVILHTKGSHYLYSQRYTSEFAKYVPECKSIDNSCTKEQLINAYDNSILYTDFILKNVFDSLRDKKALVFYTSDHGESIDHNSHFHATPLAVAPAEQRNVPILIWASDLFLKDSQSQHPYQSKNSHARHEEIFDSVLGCIGYTSKNGGIVDKNNWCSY